MDTYTAAMLLLLPSPPVGGHVMAHASTFRLSVRKGKAEQRLMKVIQLELTHAQQGSALLLLAPRSFHMPCCDGRRWLMRPTSQRPRPAVSQSLQCTATRAALISCARPGADTIGVDGINDYKD